MILESTPLASTAPSRGEAVEPGRPARARNGTEAASVKRSYARVAEDFSKDPSEPPRTAAPAKSFSLWQNSSFEFGDLIDIVNPLQHIPIVATIYRNLTGDQLGMAPRVIGGALWGRLGGFVTGVINSVVEWFTGKDIGDHIYAKIWGEPGTASTAALAAKSVGDKDAVAEVAAPPVSAATVAEPMLAPDDPPPRELIDVHQATDAAAAGISQTEWQEFLPRHFQHPPYRLGNDFGEPQDGIGKLNVNA